MKNDRIIADLAKTLRMHAGFYEDHDRDRHSANVHLTLQRAADAGLDADILEYLALDCPVWIMERVAALPGRKDLLVHYAKSIVCPRYFR